jgi:hypothetical protein
MAYQSVVTVKSEMTLKEAQARLAVVKADLAGITAREVIARNQLRAIQKEGEDLESEKEDLKYLCKRLPAEE